MGSYCLLKYIFSINKMAIENFKVEVDIEIIIPNFTKKKDQQILCLPL